MRKHGGDLDTTLIFVRQEQGSVNARALMLSPGRSVLRCRIRIHHPGPTPTPI